MLSSINELGNPRKLVTEIEMGLVGSILNPAFRCLPQSVLVCLLDLHLAISKCK